jgi:hypothetical protein
MPRKNSRANYRAVILKFWEMEWSSAGGKLATPPLDRWKAALRNLSTAELETMAEAARPHLPHVRRGPKLRLLRKDVELYEAVQEQIAEFRGFITVRRACRLLVAEQEFSLFLLGEDEFSNDKERERRIDNLRKRYERTAAKLSRKNLDLKKAQRP